MTGDIVTRDNMVLAEDSDLTLAFKVRMLMRTDLDHECICVAARDRIMYLSQENMRLRDALDALIDAAADAAGEAGRYWLEAQLKLAPHINVAIKARDFRA